MKEGREKDRSNLAHTAVAAVVVYTTIMMLYTHTPILFSIFYKVIHLNICHNDIIVILLVMYHEQTQHHQHAAKIEISSNEQHISSSNFA